MGIAHKRRYFRLVASIAAMLAGCANPPKAAPPPPPPALNFDPDKVRVSGDAIDEAVQAWMKAQHIPGLALAVVDRGRVIKAQGYGYADVRQENRVRPETAFPIASVSKPFLALGVMMLRDEGKLSLDDPIGRYLPGTPAAWKAMTIRNLLAHRSGIPSLFNDPIIVNDLSLFGWRIQNHYLDTYRDMSEKGVFDALAQQPLKFPPGTRYSYSNSNYHLLAMIVRQIAGQPYSDFLRERIFVPTVMMRTCVYGESPPLSDVAVGYRLENGHLVEGGLAFPTVEGRGFAGGGMESTVLDLALWDAALSAGKLVPEPTLRQMWTSERLPDGSDPSFGLGWQTGRIAGHPAVSHSGLWAGLGYACAFMKFLDPPVTIIILTNSGSVDWASLPDAVIETYLAP